MTSSCRALFVALCTFLLRLFVAVRSLRSVANLRSSGCVPLGRALVPRDIPFEPSQLEIVRVLGKVDIQLDANPIEEGQGRRDGAGAKEVAARAPYVRIFEARIPGGTRCFLKEYLPIGTIFGKRELKTTRQLTKRWNDLLEWRRNRKVQFPSTIFPPATPPLNGKQSNNHQTNTVDDKEDLDSLWDIDILNSAPDGSPSKEDKFMRRLDVHDLPPFPILLGTLTTDERIEDALFRRDWYQKFPRTPAPEPGNLWLVFLWDETTFRTLKRYPALPQFVSTFDYFIKSNRDAKRWRFIRKIMRKGLESLDYLQRCGYCHNAISSDSVWMTTTNQQEMDKLSIKLTDLGVCQKLKDLGPSGQEAVFEDLYQLGLVYLELIVSSFCDDNIGAQYARNSLRGDKVFANRLIYRVEDVDLTQLNAGEYQQIFEVLCQSDFKMFREFFLSIDGWTEPVKVLEKDQGEGWRLIFKLLARGRLYDETRDHPLRITGLSLIGEHRNLFDDTYVDS